MYRRDGFGESFTSAVNVDDGIVWQRVQVGKSTEERSLLVAAMVRMATVTRIMKYKKMKMKIKMTMVLRFKMTI